MYIDIDIFIDYLYFYWLFYLGFEICDLQRWCSLLYIMGWLL